MPYSTSTQARSRGAPRTPSCRRACLMGRAARPPEQQRGSRAVRRLRRPALDCQPAAVLASESLLYHKVHPHDWASRGSATVVPCAAVPVAIMQTDYDPAQLYGDEVCIFSSMRAAKHAGIAPVARHHAWTPHQHDAGIVLRPVSCLPSWPATEGVCRVSLSLWQSRKKIKFRHSRKHCCAHLLQAARPGAPAAPAASPQWPPSCPQAAKHFPANQRFHLSPTWLRAAAPAQNTPHLPQVSQCAATRLEQCSCIEHCCMTAHSRIETP